MFPSTPTRMRNAGHAHIVLCVLLLFIRAFVSVVGVAGHEEEGQKTQYLQHMVRHQAKLRRAILSGSVDCRQSSGWSKYIVPAPVNQTNAPYFHLMRPWYGRFGNNVIEIRNALRYAICCQGTLRLDPFDDKYGQPFPLAHKIASNFDFRPSLGTTPYLTRHSPASQVGPYMNLSDADIRRHIFSFSPPAQCNDRYAVSSHAMFSPATHMRNFSLPLCVYDEFSLMQQVLFGNPRPPGCEQRGETCGARFADTLVIHMRSGDIFRYSFTEGEAVKSSLLSTIRKYTQPPWAFYRQILATSERPWRRVLVVTSNEKNHSKLNPVFKYFKKRVLASGARHNGLPVQFQQSDNDTADLETFMCARYFVKASSSMSEMVVRFSTHLQEYYTPSDKIGSRCQAVAFGRRCHMLDLSPYYAAIGWHDWRNTDAQKSLMITFNPDGGVPLEVTTSG